jgi:hypothetical protein
MDWFDKNPTILMKRVKAEARPTDYFTKEEFKAIVDATHAYGDWVGGHDFEHRRHHLRASGSKNWLSGMDFFSHRQVNSNSENS